MKRKIIRLVLPVAILLLAAVLALSACTSDRIKTITDLSELDAKGTKIGAELGMKCAICAEDYYKNAELAYYPLFNEAYNALLQGKVDAMIYDKLIMEYRLPELSGVTLVDTDITDVDYVMGITPKRPELEARVNEFIEQCKADGSLEEIINRWTYDSKVMPDIPEAENPDFTLVVGTSAIMPPFTFYVDNELCGFDIELAKRLAYYLNAKLEFKIYDYSGMITACETGACDMLITSLNYTEERAQSIIMSEPYLTTKTALLLRDGFLEGSVASTVGILTGSMFGEIADEFCPDSEQLFFNSNSDLTTALLNGKIDGFITDEPVARSMVSENSAFTYEQTLMRTDYGIYMSKDERNELLLSQLDEYIAAVKADGTLSQLDSVWFGTDESLKTVKDLSSLDAENGVITAAVNSSFPPFTYIKNGQLVGYEIDLLTRFCEKYGYGLTLCDTDTGSLLTSVLSGRSDIGVCMITITDERRESGYFTEPYYEGGAVLVTLKSSSAAENNYSSFFESLALSFEKNFIRENRWQLILQGLLTTIVISVCSGVIGALLGFIVCLMRRSRNVVLRVISRVFIRIIQGTPIVVLLLIFYYVIFAAVGIDPTIVAIICFAVNFSAYAAEIFRSGIEAIDKGQTEAATALGFSRPSCFLSIILPQAARHFMPVLKGEFISLVKMTAVVGFIAVQDLTKMSDIIRSCTYEAFFPLIATAIIYFLLSWALTGLLNLIQFHIEPGRKHGIRGVVIR